MNRKQIWTIIALTLLALVITACAPKAAEAPADEAAQEALNEPLDNAAGDSNTAPQVGADDAGVADAEPMEESALEAPAVEGEYAGDADFAESEESSERAGAAGAGEEFAPPAATAAFDAPQQPDQEFVANLTAGEIDDNADWEEYLQYRTDYGRFVGFDTVNDVDISERHIINVTTRRGLPILGADVQVYAGQNLVTRMRTPATGTVYFFPRAFGVQDEKYTVSVTKGSAAQEFSIDRNGQQSVWDITLNADPAQAPVNLDVVFLIDATGSMADEIEQLKENLLSISAQVKALPSRPDVRFGMVTYRDRTDTYVVQRTDFTADVQAFQQDLNTVQAAGGGDTPEALNEALAEAVHSLNWRVDDTVSLVFLVADAPPHLDYAQDYSYSLSMIDATQLGIKIFPISSTLDDSFYQSQAEYIFRQLAQFTGGHFLFLTYDSQPTSSGDAGRDDLSVQEDSYSVEDLDALVTRLITEELAALSGRS